jgi:hypothetical protein
MTTSKKPPRTDPGSVDESAESEITILPDGRVCAFGITRPVAELLASLPTADEHMKRLLHRICGLDAQAHRERRDG